MPIQSQGIITKDNVSIDLSAVAYYRVKDPIRSVIAIENVQACGQRSGAIEVTVGCETSSRWSRLRSTRTPPSSSPLR